MKKMTRKEKEGLSKQGVCWKCGAKITITDGIMQCENCGLKVVKYH